MTQTQTPYTLTDQAAAELRAIRLAEIKDQIRTAERLGRESVHLLIEDAWWLARLVKEAR